MLVQILTSAGAVGSGGASGHLTRAFCARALCPVPRLVCGSAPAGWLSALVSAGRPGSVVLKQLNFSRVGPLPRVHPVRRLVGLVAFALCVQSSVVTA